jgi:hypothetical protein
VRTEGSSPKARTIIGPDLQALGEKATKARRATGEMIHQIGCMHRQPILDCVQRRADEQSHVMDHSALIG